jgi:hypothetical protein
MKKTTFYLILFILPSLALEFGSRLYWSKIHDIPSLSPHLTVASLYPSLIPLLAKDEQDQAFNILLLGGSVLGQIYQPLKEKLEKIKPPVKVFSVSIPGHTSMDSFYKYKFLKNKQFDLVIFYHGINEVRANYIEPKSFKIDYSHFYWYSVLGALDSHFEHQYIVFPFTIHFLYLTLKKIALNELEHTKEIPRFEYLDYGKKVNSATTFEYNLKNLVRLTRERGSKFMLMTFANDTPEGGYPQFSAERYKKIYKDFHIATSSCCPIEIWGKPRHVMNGIKIHNDVINKFVKHNQDVIFIDQDKNLSNKHSYFSDVCHFNPEGIKAFIQLMEPHFLKVIESQRLL